jgi:hypothetical protein
MLFDSRIRAGFDCRLRSVQQRWSTDSGFGLGLAAMPRASVQLAPCLVHSESRAVASAARVRFGARALELRLGGG